MTQYVELSCPGCQRALRIRTTYLGRQIACNYCNHAFTMPPHGEPGPDPVHPPPAVKEQTAEQQAARPQEHVDEERCAPSTPAPEQTVPEGGALARDDDAHPQAEEQELREPLEERADRENDHYHEAVTLRRQLENAQTESAQLRARIAELEVLARATAPLNAELNANRAASARLQAELATCREASARLAEQVAAGESAARELHAVQVERDALQDEIHHARAELAQIAAALQGSRAGADKLTHDTEAQRLRIAKLEQVCAEASVTHAQIAHEHREARNQWDAEREALRHQVEADRKTFLQATQKEAMRQQVEADRKTLLQETEERQRHEQVQAESSRQEFERERAALHGEIEQLRQRSIALQRECETSASQFKMLKQERDELGQRQEVDKHFWAAFGLQNPALQKNRQQAEAAARERAELAEQVQTLRRELDERRRSDAVTNPQAGEVNSAKSAANGTKNPLRTVLNTYFQNRTIVLDGHEYAGCELWDCRLVFQGQESFSIHDCRLGGCRLVFEGAAQTTLGTLRALYQDFAFRSMVEYTIKQIMGALPATPGSIGR